MKDMGGTFMADPEVVASEVDGGAALLDLRSSQYYGLNTVGAFVWSQIQTPQTLDGLAVSVSEAFDVEASACRADIAGLLNGFLEVGVVRHDA